MALAPITFEYVAKGCCRSSLRGRGSNWDDEFIERRNGGSWKDRSGLMTFTYTDNTFMPEWYVTWADDSLQDDIEARGEADRRMRGSSE